MLLKIANQSSILNDHDLKEFVPFVLFASLALIKKTKGFDLISNTFPCEI